ncbi:MAG: PHP domain-containing protein [Gemmatimonadota bacterium]|nr:PHP domain-containing protein [Gemmatimonadota bacterium]
MSRVDLHLHSLASDGTTPPAVVARAVAAAGLSGFSLTDHDTVAGLDEAAEEAERLGLAFLPGAELSANEPGRSVHVLGYGFDPSHPKLRAFFATFRSDRMGRAEAMTERLRGLGVPLEMDAVMREAVGGVPTRAHLARALVREGLAGGVEEVFRRWLARGRPAFVEKRPSPPAEAFALLHEAGGVAVLAHPGREFGEADIRRWVADGLDGVEVLHPANPPAVRARLGRLVREAGLLATGGSDWHGPDTGRAEPGSERVPAAWMQRLRERVATRSD